MTKIDKIIVLGIESCGFCDIQLQRLQGSFASKQIAYIDLIKDEGALDIAEDLKLEYTPSTIVLSGSKVVLKRTGLIAADELFYAVNKTIPADLEFFASFNLSKNEILPVSFKPIFNKNKIVIQSYNQDIAIDAKLKSISKVGSSEMIEKLGEEKFEKYKKRTGKDNGFLLDLKRGE